jgi:hypothetical protein
MRIKLVAFLSFVVLLFGLTTAEAASTHRRAQTVNLHADNSNWFDASVKPAKKNRVKAAKRKRSARHVVKHRKVAKHKPTQTVPELVKEAGNSAARAVTETREFVGTVFHKLTHRGNAPVDGLPDTLRSKLAEIQNACAGFRVISTRCGAGGHSWNVSGTRRTSLHCTNKAVDFQVNDYGCAYRQLAGWRGGISGDPKEVSHIHLSWGGHEGQFCHGGHGGRNCIFAKHRAVSVARRQ